MVEYAFPTLKSKLIHFKNKFLDKLRKIFRFLFKTQISKGAIIYEPFFDGKVGQRINARKNNVFIIYLWKNDAI